MSDVRRVCVYPPKPEQKGHAPHLLRYCGEGEYALVPWEEWVRLKTELEDLADELLCRDNE